VEAPATAEGSGVWDPDAADAVAVAGTDTKGSKWAKTDEVVTRVPGSEAAGFSLAAGLTAAFLEEADAFPEEAAAFWRAGSAFSDGSDAFTGVGVALGAGDMIGAEAGSTGSGAWPTEGTWSGLEASLATMGAAFEVEGTTLDDVGAALGWEATDCTFDERDWDAGCACAFWLAKVAAGLAGAGCLGMFLNVDLMWEGLSAVPASDWGMFETTDNPWGWCEVTGSSWSMSDTAGTPWHCSDTWDPASLWFDQGKESWE